MSAAKSSKHGGGRVTPKQRPTRAGEPEPGLQALDLATARQIFGQLFGNPTELRNAAAITVEMRASGCWNVLRKNTQLYSTIIQTLVSQLREGSAEARDYLRMLNCIAEPGLAAQLNTILRSAPDIPALPPLWINQAGRAVIEETCIYESPLGDDLTVNLICRHPKSDQRHEIVAFVDPILEFAFDVGVFRASDEPKETGEMRRRVIDPAFARAHIERALWAYGLADDDTAVVAMRYELLKHYAAKLPEGMSLPERVPLDDEAAADRAAAFLGTTHGTALLAGTGADRDVLLAVVASLTRLLHNLIGDADRLTARSISVVSNYFAELNAEHGDAAKHLPAVLESLVRAAHENKRWDPKYLEPTLDSIKLDPAGLLRAITEADYPA